MRKFQYCLLYYTCLLLLTACGGGSESPESKNPNAELILYENEVEFNAIFRTSGGLNSHYAVGSVVDFTEGTAYIKVLISNKGVINAQETKLELDLNAGLLEIVPGSHTALGPGVHTDTIEIQACYDRQCSSHIKGSPAFINVTYNIEIPQSHKLWQGTLTIDDMITSEITPSILTLNTNLSPTNVHLSSDLPENILKFTWLNEENFANNYKNIAYTVELKDDINIEPGEYNGSVSFISEVSGHDITLDIPTKVFISPKLLQVSQQSIALTKFKSSGKLSHQLDIYEITGSDSFTWEAESNVDWLQITESGSSAQSLQIEAVPGGLTTDAMHYAKITISSDDPLIENTQTVNVGLWVDNEEQTNITVFNYELSDTDSIIVGPLRPYLYSTQEMEGSSNIQAINYYTDSVEFNLEINESDLGITNIVISPSGKYLYVSHSTRSQQGGRTNFISNVNLFTQKVERKWSVYNSYIYIDRIISPLENDLLISGKKAFNPFDRSQENYYAKFSDFNIRYDKRFSNYCYYNVNLICGQSRFSNLQKVLNFEDKIEISQSEVFGRTRMADFSVSPDGKLVGIISENTIAFVDILTGEILNQYEPTSSLSGTELSWTYDGHLLGFNYTSEYGELYKFSIDGATTKLDFNLFDKLTDEKFRGVIYSADGLSTIVLLDDNKFATIQNNL